MFTANPDHLVGPDRGSRPSGPSHAPRAPERNREPSEQNAFIRQAQCLFGEYDGFQMSMGWGLGVSHVLA